MRDIFILVALLYIVKATTIRPTAQFTFPRPRTAPSARDPGAHGTDVALDTALPPIPHVSEAKCG